jgi:excisionase family DNA binding protein
MFSLIAFLTGLILLIRGQFRVGSRLIPAQRARMMGIILMSPFLLQFCISFVLVSNIVSVLPDGTVSINQEDFYETVDSLNFLQIIAVAIASGIVIYMVYATPPSAGVPVAGSTPYTAPNATQPSVHDILTVPEAAAYLRVSEAEVMRLIDEGKLPAARIGDSFRIARIAIDDFLKEGKQR